MAISKNAAKLPSALCAMKAIIKNAGASTCIETVKYISKLSTQPSSRMGDIMYTPSSKKPSIRSFKLNAGLRSKAPLWRISAWLWPLVVALDLAHAYRPVLGHFFVTFGPVVVDGEPAPQQQPVGEVGVFGQHVVVPAAHRFQGADADAADGATVLRHQAQVHAGLLVDLVATGAFQVQ